MTNTKSISILWLQPQQRRQIKKIKFNVEKYEKILNRKISLHIFNKKQFLELKKKNPEFAAMIDCVRQRNAAQQQKTIFPKGR